MKINNASKTWFIEDVEAVIFDKDGTLIDAHFYWGEIIKRRASAVIEHYNLDGRICFNKICEVLGYDTLTAVLLPQGPIALVSRDQVIDILNVYLNKIKLESNIIELNSIFEKVHNDFIGDMDGYVKLLDGVQVLLEKMFIKQIKMCIVTSDSVTNTQRTIDKLNLSKYFNLIVGKESCHHAKDTGMPATIAMQKMRVNASKTITIGDSPVDVIMSSKSEQKASIAVSTGQVSITELQKCTPYCVGSLCELEVF